MASHDKCSKKNNDKKKDTAWMSFNAINQHFKKMR